MIYKIYCLHWRTVKCQPPRICWVLNTLVPCPPAAFSLLPNVKAVIYCFFPSTFKVFKVPLQKTWRRQWRPTLILLPGKSHGWRSLVGCSPWGCKELDTNEQLHFHFSLSCIGEGNVNPLQCSCLENPRDGGAWWAAVYGVAQSWTRVKSLSSSSSYRKPVHFPW